MKKIDTSKWKEFLIGDLFDIHPTKAYKKINIELFEEDGANPVIVNTGFKMELADMQIWSAQRKPEPLHLLTQQRKVQILFSIKREISSVIHMCKECTPKHMSGQEMKACS